MLMNFVFNLYYLFSIYIDEWKKMMHKGITRRMINEENIFLIRTKKSKTDNISLQAK